MSKLTPLSDGESMDTREAFGVLKKAIQDDPEYAFGWHSNIAMALFDAMPDQTFWMPDRSKYSDIANDAASSFMSRVFEVKTSQRMLMDDE